MSESLITNMNEQELKEYNEISEKISRSGFRQPYYDFWKLKLENFKLRFQNRRLMDRIVGIDLYKPKKITIECPHNKDRCMYKELVNNE